DLANCRRGGRPMTRGAALRPWQLRRFSPTASASRRPAARSPLLRRHPGRETRNRQRLRLQPRRHRRRPLQRRPPHRRHPPPPHPPPRPPPPLAAPPPPPTLFAPPPPPARWASVKVGSMVASAIAVVITNRVRSMDIPRTSVFLETATRRRRQCFRIATCLGP